MGDVKWVRYKAYSGLKIKGTELVSLPETDHHMKRAYWLTAMLEAPYWGSVQSYDGAAMSGGPLHNIAVYPRSMKQGSMFPLLRHLEFCPSEGLDAVWNELREVGWYIARDGKLRDWYTGKVISGRAIRNEFTPTDGKVPRRGNARKQATKWLLLFHNLLSDASTFDAQQDFAISYMIRTRKAEEAQFYQERDLEVLRAGDKTTKTKLAMPLDFAMCVYHAHSVNAPTPAKSVLLKTLNEISTPYDRPMEFAKRMIFNLGKKRYGRWRDTADGKNRYDRTRYWAKKSGLWPDEYFDEIMPNNLPPRWTS